MPYGYRSSGNIIFTSIEVNWQSPRWEALSKVALWNRTRDDSGAFYYPWHIAIQAISVVIVHCSVSRKRHYWRWGSSNTRVALEDRNKSKTKVGSICAGKKKKYHSQIQGTRMTTTLRWVGDSELTKEISAATIHSCRGLIRSAAS